MEPEMLGVDIYNQIPNSAYKQNNLNFISYVQSCTIENNYLNNLYKLSLNISTIYIIWKFIIPENG